jgi:uncharacterized protein YhhL (DUF1145 family)
MTKIIMSITWLVGLASFFIAMPEPLDTILYWLIVFLVVAHLLECAVFFNRVMKAEGNKFGHFLQIFLFGVFHAMSLPK